MLEQWEFFLASRAFVGGEFQINEWPHVCRGPIASIRISRGDLRIRAEWLASEGNVHGKWHHVTPPLGFVWRFPIDPNYPRVGVPAHVGMIITEREFGQLDVNVPGMGSYTLLPRDHPDRLTAEQVKR